MNEIDASVSVKIAGQFRCVLNEGTDRERDTGWFDNLVTDQGLNRLGSAPGTNLLYYCSVGTGTNAAADSDTALQTYMAQAIYGAQSGSNLGSPLYKAEALTTYVFDQGAVVGNMAEIGVGWSTGGTNLWSRSRIVDGGGTPTTLTLTSIDQLTVYYKVTITPDLTDRTGSVVIGGVTYAYTARLANATNFFANAAYMLMAESGWGGNTNQGAMTGYDGSSTLGAITAEPSGTSQGGSVGGAPVRSTYTAGNFYIDYTWTAAPADLNPSGGGGLGCIKFSFGNSGGQYQYHFTPAIPKDNTKTLSLVTRYAWSR